MRTIGLDLAVQTAHTAVVLDERAHFCTPILTVYTQPSELDQLLARHAVPIYLVTSQELADLRRYEHASCQK